METTKENESFALARLDANRGINPYEPQNYDQAIAIAGVLAKAVGRPVEQVFLQMMAAAEIGIGGTAALQMIDILDGQNGRMPAYRARLMVSLCLRARGICEYIESVSSDATQATWRAKRVGRPERVVRYAIEDAQRAKLVKSGGAYEKDPESQLNARASARLARLVFPDLVGNMYTPEEIAEMGTPPPLFDGQVIEQPREKSAAPVVDRAAELEAKVRAATSQAEGDAIAAEIVEAFPDKASTERKRFRGLLTDRKAAGWAIEPAHDIVTGEVVEREPGSDDEAA